MAVSIGNHVSSWKQHHSTISNPRRSYAEDATSPLASSSSPTAFSRPESTYSTAYQQQLEAERRDILERQIRMREMSIRRNCGLLLSSPTQGNLIFRDPFSYGCSMPSPCTMARGEKDTSNRCPSYNDRIEKRMEYDSSRLYNVTAAAG